MPLTPRIERILGFTRPAGTGISILYNPAIAFAAALQHWWSTDAGNFTLDTNGRFSALSDISGNGITLANANVNTTRPLAVTSTATGKTGLQFDLGGTGGTQAQTLTSAATVAALQPTGAAPFTIFLATKAQLPPGSNSFGWFYGQFDTNYCGWAARMEPGATNLSLLLENTFGGNNAAARGGTALATGSFVTAIIRFDPGVAGSGKAGSISISINGVTETMTIDSDTLASSTIVGGTSARVFLGTFNGAHQPPNLTLFEGGYINRALSSAEVAKLNTYLQRWSGF